jgi:fumarate hydratase class II
MIYSLLQSIRLLADGVRSFTDRLVVGIRPDRERIETLMQGSLMLVTALSPHIGYDRAAEVAHEAHRSGKTLRETAVAMGVVTAADFDRWVRPEAMVGEGDKAEE